MAVSLFTNCKLTISKDVSTKNGKLLKLITEKLQFKIIGIDPLVIEKDSPSQQDMDNLNDALKEFLVLQEVEDWDFVSEVEEEERKSKHKTTRETLKISNPVQTSFQHRQVKDVPKGQQLVKKSSNHENLSCVENTSSRCESEQSPQLQAPDTLVTSVQPLLKEKGTNYFQKYSKTTVSQMTHDSIENLEGEMESTQTADVVREYETQCGLTRRKNSTDDFLSHSEILSKHNYETSGNEMVTKQVKNAEKQEHGKEVVGTAQGQAFRQICEESKIIAMTTNQEVECRFETDMDVETDSKISCRDSEIDSNVESKMHVFDSGEKLSSEEKSREKTTNVNIYSQKIEQRDDNFKQEDLCSSYDLSYNSKMSKFGQAIQSEDGSCKRSLFGNNAVEEELTKQKDKKGLIAGNLDHGTYKIEEQIENLVGQQVDMTMTEIYSQREGVSTTERCVFKDKEVNKQFKEDYTKKDIIKVDEGDCRQAKLPRKSLESYTLPKDQSSLIQDEHQKERREYDKMSETADRQKLSLLNMDRSLLQHRSVCERNNQMEQECKETELSDNKKNPLESHNLETFAGNYYHDKQFGAQLMEHEEPKNQNIYPGQMLEQYGQSEDYSKIQMEKVSGGNCGLNNVTKLTSGRKLDEVSADRPAPEGNLRTLGEEKNTAAWIQQNLSTPEYSSESDEESQEELIYSLSPSSFKVAKLYFEDSKFKSYFEHVEECTFKLDAHNERDIEFLDTIKQLRFEEYEFVQEGITSARSVIQKIMSEVNGSTLCLVDNMIHIIGSKDVVAAAKRKLDLHTRSEKINRNDDASKRSGVTEEKKLEIKQNFVKNDKEFRGSEKGESQFSHFSAARPSRASHKEDDRLSSLQERSHDFDKRDYSMTHFGASGYGSYSKAQNDNCIVTDKGNLKVKVYKANITKLEVDCIVNAANKRLRHGGGVAKAIAEAAGSALTNECEDFIKAGNVVAVTNIFVSGGGKLPYQRVMHAVGPKWEDYDDKSKSECLRDLRQTILRCLVEASRRNMTSIALPSISAAIFKVPKDQCAKCYMEAVKHFDIISDEEKFSLREIHFVDVDDTMVDIIKECFHTSLFKPCDPEILKKDHEFARRHQHDASRNETSNQPKKSGPDKTFPDYKKPGSSTASTRTSSAGKSEIGESYEIGNTTLLIDTKPAFNLASDITITVGKPFDKLSGLQDYNIENNSSKCSPTKMFFSKNAFQYFEATKPGSKGSRLVLAVYPEPDDAGKIKDAFQNLETAIESSDKSVTKLILTSSVLYAEPANKQHPQKKKIIDSKKVGKFAHILFDYLFNLETSRNISVTVVGSEDAVSSIKRVLESRELTKMASGAHPFTEQGGSRMARSRGESSEHQQQRSSSHSSMERSSSHNSVGMPNLYSYDNRGVATSVDPLIECGVCLEYKPCRPVSCCRNYLCQVCEQRVSTCPFCRTVWRIQYGDQPLGYMNVDLTHDHCFGYDSSQAWRIEYWFPAGVQQECHPNPREPYKGILRTAYLPAIDDGLKVLLLLRLAFMRKLTFTIGHSSTANKEGVIVWNDIHHKTVLYGRPYGYPDPGYLQRVHTELASKGVFLENLAEFEQQQINYFYSSLITYKTFKDPIRRV